MTFKKLGIDDFKLACKYFSAQNSRMSDFSCGAVYIWADYLGTEFCEENDTLFLRFHDKRYEHNVYAYPLTKGDIKDAVNKIWALDKTRPPVLVATPEAALPLLSKHYDIEYHYNRTWSDYLYDAEEFMSFKGKKFHQKRNHISKFIRTYGEPFYEKVDEKNLSEVISFLENYEQTGLNSNMAVYEYKKNFDVFKNLEKLNQFGGLIRAGDKIVAIAAGEVVGDTLFVHIEKALREYDGAYTVIANEFAKRNASGLKFINREDDAGDEGLRKSKLSYNPVGFVDKYVVRIKSEK